MYAIVIQNFDSHVPEKTIACDNLTESQNTLEELIQDPHPQIESLILGNKKNIICYLDGEKKIVSFTKLVYNAVAH